MGGATEAAMKLVQLLAQRAQVLPLNGHKVAIMKTPSEYFHNVLDGMSSASQRLLIASLYCGIGGGCEAQCLGTLKAAITDPNRPSLETTVLLDALRGTRPTMTPEGHASSSALELSRMLTDRTHVALFHTPSLRGLLKRVLPPRMNEIIGVSHIKAYVFDDDVLMSGANWSSDYFTIRQDRYMVFKDFPQLAAWLHALVKGVAEFSYTLQPGAMLTPGPAGINPITQSAAFQQAMRTRLEELSAPGQPNTTPSTVAEQSDLASTPPHSCIQASQLPLLIAQQHGQDSAGDASVHASGGNSVLEEFSSMAEQALGDQIRRPPAAMRGNPRERTAIGLSTLRDKCDGGPGGDGIDTWIVPTVQLGAVGVRQDEMATAAFLRAAQPGSTLTLSSPYLNLSRPYKLALASASKVNISILTASPSANGFFGAAGAAGFIPTAYSLLQQSTWRFLTQAWSSAGSAPGVQRQLLEYQREGWQFHAKGIWYTPPGETLPIATAIGSPNFGYRSVHRDLECQLFMVTTNKELRQALQAEVDALQLHAVDVSNAHVPDRQHSTSYRARLAARLMRSFL